MAAASQGPWVARKSNQGISGSTLPVGFTGFWGGFFFFVHWKRFSWFFVHLSCLVTQAHPMHQYFLSISQVPPTLGAAACVGVVLCPKVASTAMPGCSATPLLCGAFGIPVIAFARGPSFLHIFQERGV